MYMPKTLFSPFPTEVQKLNMRLRNKVKKITPISRYMFLLLCHIECSGLKTFCFPF